MNRKFLMIIFGIFLISCVSATAYEINSFKYGVINNDGTTSDTTTTVSNVNVIGYVCANSDCSSFSGTLWNGNVLTGDQMTLVYPTTLQSSYGYAIYMYRDDYRTYERMGVTWYGEGNAPSYTNYLRKMQSGESTVNDLDVSVSGSVLDVVANVQSPLEHIGPLSYFPPQLISYYSTKVDVILEVTNSLGAIVYTETKIVSIEYSHDKDVDFTATVVPGNYDVKVYTKLDNEPKILTYTSDEEVVSATVAFPDNDGDGFNSDVDCDDNNVFTWQLLAGYVDADRDGYGVNPLLNVCSGNSLPIGYVSINGDCNDGSSLINPGAVEICGNGIDENCDGVDEDCVVDLVPTINLFSVSKTSGNAPLTIQFNCQATGGDGVLSYLWSFGNEDNSNLQETIYVYDEAGDYTATCTVTDEDGDTDSESIVIEVTEVPVATAVEVISISGFDFVVEGENQAIRVFVENDLGLPEAGVDIDVYYSDSDNSLFGSCVTGVTGGCAVEVEQVIGNYEVYAVASKSGLTGDSSGIFRFSYSVLEKVYDIIDLRIYGDDGEKTEFYRGENLFVSFSVEEEGIVADDVIASASLVNLGTGENFDLVEISNEDGEYIYGMVIPYGPEFLGSNQLFAFAFNFVDGSGGQAEATLTILNNAPEIKPVILNQSLREGQTKNIDLSMYESDAEDSGEDLSWEVDDGLTKISVTLIGKILTIKGLDVGEETIILRLYDSDGGFDEQVVNVEVLEKSSGGNGGSSRTVSVGFIGDGADKEVLDFETKTIPLGAEAIGLSGSEDMKKSFEIPWIIPFILIILVIILFLWVIVRII